MNFGSNVFSLLGNSMKNTFWKQVFKTVAPIIQGALFCYPDKFILSPLWDNPMILRNNSSLKKANYPLLCNLNSVADFYHVNSGRLKNRDELEESMRCTIDRQTFIEFHHILSMARQRVGMSDSIRLNHQLPSQPLLVHIVNFTQKGCSVYYRFLRKKINLTTSLAARENKWHRELDCVYSTEYWNKIYRLTAEINKHGSRHLKLRL